MKYTVVTTFNQQGLQSYGKRMVQTFLQNWPKTVDLWVYTEDCTIDQPSQNLQILDLLSSSSKLVAFKQKWQNVPYATGNVSGIPALASRPDAGKSFKWDAVRFSHKVYAIEHCFLNCDADILLWMDGDMVCHSAITESDVGRMCPPTYDIAFLGRGKKFSECGLYMLNCRSAPTKNFVSDFVGMYDNAQTGIFTLEEWHDSFVFDHVRNQHCLNSLDWSQGLFKGEGHPLINSEWGRWLDHLKGARKQLGRSKAKDLRVQRTETYWRM